MLSKKIKEKWVRQDRHLSRLKRHPMAAAIIIREHKSCFTQIFFDKKERLQVLRENTYKILQNALKSIFKLFSSCFVLLWVIWSKFQRLREKIQRHLSTLWNYSNRKSDVLLDICDGNWGPYANTENVVTFFSNLQIKSAKIWKLDFSTKSLFWMIKNKKSESAKIKMRKRIRETRKKSKSEKSRKGRIVKTVIKLIRSSWEKITIIIIASRKNNISRMSELESFSGAAGHSGGILKAKNGNLLKVGPLS